MSKRSKQIEQNNDALSSKQVVDHVEISKKLEELAAATEKNTKTLELIEQKLGLVRGWVITQRIWFIVKIIIISIPIILGVVYLPPLLQEYAQQVQNFYLQFSAPTVTPEQAQQFFDQNNNN